VDQGEVVGDLLPGEGDAYLVGLLCGLMVAFLGYFQLFVLYFKLDFKFFVLIYYFILYHCVQIGKGT
jgi:hypothetical protein